MEGCWELVEQVLEPMRDAFLTKEADKVLPEGQRNNTFILYVQTSELDFGRADLIRYGLIIMILPASWTVLVLRNLFGLLHNPFSYRFDDFPGLGDTIGIDAYTAHLLRVGSLDFQCISSTTKYLNGFT